MSRFCYYIIIKADDEEISGYHFLDNKIDLRFFLQFPHFSHVYHFLDYKICLGSFPIIRFCSPHKYSWFSCMTRGHFFYQGLALIMVTLPSIQKLLSQNRLVCTFMFDVRWFLTLIILLSEIIASIVNLTITVLDDRLLQNECGLWSLWWSGHSFHGKLHAIR